MGIFSAIVKTTIEVAKLPVALLKDCVTIGGVLVDEPTSFTEQKLDDIKDAAEDQ